MKSIQPLSNILFISSENENEIIESLQKLELNVIKVDSIVKAEEIIEEIKPDLILTKSNLTGDHGLSFCSYIRDLQINPRPIIVFLVDENNPDERIEILRSGADDVIVYPISGKEIAFRVIAHLRRRQETHINTLTGLPNAIILNNVLENCLKSVDDWAILSIDLDNLRIYNEAYGEKQGDQMIKALAAVLKSVLLDDDFLAHRDSDDFILITRNERAEAIAEEICRRFDFISPRFYTQEDARRGYVIATGSKGIRRRVQLVSISIGITGKDRRVFKSSVEVLQTARDMRYLAKSKSGSDWVSDRLRISSNEINESEKRMKILVVEQDASMSLLLRDTLEMEGYAVDIAHTPLEAWDLIQSWKPELILLEAEFQDDEFDGWALTRKIKQDFSLSGTWLVVTTKNPDHLKALEAGADLYLPKPYELHVLFSEIKYLLRTRIRSKIII